MQSRQLTCIRNLFLVMMMSFISPVPVWAGEIITKPFFVGTISCNIFYYLIDDIDFECLEGEQYLDDLIDNSENFLKIYIENKQRKWQRIKNFELIQLLAALLTVKHSVENCIFVEDLWCYLNYSYSLAKLKRAERNFLRTIRYDLSVVPDSFLYLLFNKNKLVLIPNELKHLEKDPQFIEKRKASVARNQAYLEELAQLTRKILKIYEKNKRAKRKAIKDISLVQIIAVLVAHKYLAEDTVWIKTLYRQINDQYELNALKKAEIKFLKTIDYKLSFLEPLILVNKAETENKTPSDDIITDSGVSTAENQTKMSALARTWSR